MRQLTNYGPLIRNKGALTLSDKDKETVDLLFEISKNEGERHGKMPTFGREGKPVVPEKPVAATKEKEEKRPASTASKKPIINKDEDEVKKVDEIKKIEDTKKKAAIKEEEDVTESVAET